jgi:hypothetical protein
MNYVSDLDSLICGFDPVFLLTKHDTWHSLIDIKLQNKCEKLKYFFMPIALLGLNVNL